MHLILVDGMVITNFQYIPANPLQTLTLPQKILIKEKKTYLISPRIG